MKQKHLVLLSGGESSAIVAIHVAKKYGKENVLLLNHNIRTGMEHDDIKRFKQEIADFIGLPITYANIDGIENPDDIPDQFDVCLSASNGNGAFTSPNGMALCTAFLKTKPFHDFLHRNFPPYPELFTEHTDLIIYYGFDENEKDRVMRRSGLLGAMGYKTKYPIFRKEVEIQSTSEIGIKPPSTYSVFKHANCIGCLKAGLLHWYVTYCLRPDVYDKGSDTEQKIGYCIHRVTRNGVTDTISLEELRPIFMQMQLDGVPATEHQSDKKFGRLLRKYQIEQCNVNKPCECTE